MPDTTLQLGDFTFARFEIPEQIPFGGEQRLVVHELVGGTRIIDAMGETSQPLEWSGIFVGSSALDRAQYLDGLRKAGQPLSLTWSEFSYTVVIRSFHCDFVRFYRLPYRITCEVVSDDTTPITTITDPSPEQQVDDDLDLAGDLSDQIGDSGLSAAMSDLNGAFAAVGRLTSASPAALAGLALPLNAARSQVTRLLGVAGAVIGGSGGFGGVAPFALPTFTATALQGQVSAISSSPTLVMLDRTLGRVQANIGALNAGTRSVAVAGGDLFSVASEQYGDARGWSTIAAANKLVDPMLSGIADLTIPPLPAGVDGILNG